MGDIRTLYDPTGPSFEYALEDGDLESDEGLETAVVISLFSDRRAGADDDPPGGPEDKRGWWGDALAEKEGDRIGSRLWLLAREKNIPRDINKARAIAEEALAWLVEDGIAERVVVTAEALAPEVLGLTIEIHRPESPPARFRFDTFWNTL